MAAHAQAAVLAQGAVFARTADLVTNKAGPAADKQPDGLAAPDLGG